MLSSREKLEIFKGRLGLFDKNLKVVGHSGSKQPKMEISVPTAPQTNKDVEVDPKKEQSDPIGIKNEETEQDPKKKCLMELATASTNLVLHWHTWISVKNMKLPSSIFQTTRRYKS
ncbi:uncharacterized protein LOC110733910 [Chenopodium quinoa]|uniref:uncharacterized protein LOC110733910 n=1 Tax=Chenopodium quinoa TaxID=63459 RepID=UPI000B7701A4|nr:uncharacterized protein LOC110733910 [Chenopodium quinoa]